ncbi:hypothetical protein [Corynebacterium macginleyi]|uniref:hypothetical protein n=1 Tax=Corynebacterium macginleyi TaxID=38290 RepID=UPI000EF98B82|nr:hypothetical protein [Corynebacterium macginleyi]QRP20931.1 hypothetical protein I6J25_09620 [Corynebacterium macginleyi]RMB65530.1 hypothetical protein D9V82_08385 [Corynebacterium macginleyi]
MPIDQHDLAHAAKKLQVLYEELNHAKYQRPPAPEVSTQGANQQKGPSEPFPIWTISDDAHFTALLNEYCTDAARYVPLTGDIYTHGFQRNGTRMCQWIAWNAGPISQLDVAPLMLDELNHQARELNHRLRRTRPPEPISEPQEAWLTARTICYRLRQQGHNVSPELLRKWAEREKISSLEDCDGKKKYLQHEVLFNLAVRRNSAG